MTLLRERIATITTNSRGRASSPVIPAIALAAAMLLGGSGSLIPLPEMAIECVLAALATAWVWTCPDDLRGVPRGAWIIAVLVLAVPVAQLLPLPPDVWHSLPGRSAERAALDLIGQGSRWQPLSLTPDRTLAALLAMMAAIAVLVMAAAQDRRGRAVLLATMATMALLSVLVGAAQLSGGNGNRFRFYYPDEAFLDGFQTNHNAQADVLLIGMVALAAAGAEFIATRRQSIRAQSIRAQSIRGQPVRGRPVLAQRRASAPVISPPVIYPWLMLGMIGGATLLLALGVVLTASRTGIALLPIAVATQALILRRWLRWQRRHMAMAVLATLAGAGIVAAASGYNGALARVWHRFHTPTEFRPEIWHDAVFALRQLWPWGAGMGSFIPIFAAAERLEVVTDKFVNRAHNDYLEFLIEAGVPGIIAFGLIIRQIAEDGWRSWHGSIMASQTQILCGGASLLILALHSLGDYPLRTISIACMIAVEAALMLPVAEHSGLGNGHNCDDM